MFKRDILKKHIGTFGNKKKTHVGNLKFVKSFYSRRNNLRAKIQGL